MACSTDILTYQIDVSMDKSKFLYMRHFLM